MPSTKYTLENVLQEVRDYVITHFRLVVHTAGLLQPGRMTSYNHWSIYLLHSNGCVRLNMALPDFGGQFGIQSKVTLSVTSHSWITAPHSAVKYWDFKAKDKLTVGNVLGLIRNNRLWKYEMNTIGMGCRHWVSVVMANMFSNGYAIGVSIEGSTVAGIIHYNWSKGQEPIYHAYQPGRFL